MIMKLTHHGWCNSSVEGGIEKHCNCPKDIPYKECVPEVTEKRALIQQGLFFREGAATRLAKYIHYPECWDTAAYPTLADAIFQIVTNAGCSEHPLRKFQPVGPARIG